MADFDSTVSAAVGASVSGVLVLSWVKLLTSRLIKQYDERHLKHDERLERLTDGITNMLMDIKAKLAAIEVRAAEIQVLKDSFDKNTREVISLSVQQKKHSQDIAIAHQRIRMMGGNLMGDKK